MTKRYLVTGGNGFIGKTLVKRLVEENNFVRVLDNGFRNPNLALPNSTNVEYVTADIRDLQSVEKACKDIHAIFHLAFINGTKYFYKDPGLVLDVGVRGMLNVLDGAKKYQVKELYLASSSEVYQTPRIIPTPEDVPMVIPDPKNPRYSYAGGKIISELLVLHQANTIFQKTVIIRPHNVYGPDMGYEHVIPELIEKILERTKPGTKEIDIPIQGDGSNTRSFVYIDDFVDGVMLLLAKGKSGEIYNIGTEDEISILSLIKKLAQITGLKIAISKSVGPEGNTPRRCPDITKIRKLGFSPKTQLVDGLQLTYDWYSRNVRK